MRFWPHCVHRQEAGRDEFCYSSCFSLPIQTETLAHEFKLLIFRVGLPTSVIPLWKCSHRHLQRFLPPGIPNSIKLKISVIRHTHNDLTSSHQAPPPKGPTTPSLQWQSRILGEICDPNHNTVILPEEP